MSVSRLAVGYDADCARCQRFRCWVSRQDHAHRIVAESAQQPTHPALRAIDPADRMRKIHAVDFETGTVYQGYAAVVEILARIAWLRRFAPLMRLVGRIGLGEWIYRRVANRG